MCFRYGECNFRFFFRLKIPQGNKSPGMERDEKHHGCMKPKKQLSTKKICLKNAPPKTNMASWRITLFHRREQSSNGCFPIVILVFVGVLNFGVTSPENERLRRCICFRLNGRKCGVGVGELCNAIRQYGFCYHLQKMTWRRENLFILKRKFCIFQPQPL